jgi:hypothetical protein
MVDPDDMSAASDEEMSGGGGGSEGEDEDMPQDSDEEGMGGGDGPDSDEEDARDDDDDDAAPPGTREEAGDEEEDDEDAIPEPDPDPEPGNGGAREEEQEEPEPQKKAKPPATGIMKHFQVKQNQEKAAPKAGPSKSAEAPKAPAATSRPKGGKAAAAAAAQPVALGSKSGAAKGGKAKGQERPSKAAATAPAKKSKEPAKASEFSFHDSEEEEVEMTMPQKKAVPLAAPPDVEQELEDFSKGGGGAASASARAEDGGAADAPPVSEMAKKRRYVLKNEKTKRWAEWLPKGLLYAPECKDLFDFSMDDLTVQSKKDRLVAQHKLVDEQMSKLMQTLLIGSLTTDSTGSGSGPGMTNLMCGIPSKLPLQDKELDDLLSRLKARDGDQEAEVVLLHVLDHEIVKRVFKVHNAPVSLPSLFNPNTNASNKFKVPNQLEKVKDFDDNFVELGLIEKAKQRAAKRSTDERPNGGSKADGKRPANGVVAAPSNAEAEKNGTHPEYEEDTLSICGNPTLMKVFTSKDFATSYAELRCKEDQKFTVCQAGPGKFILLLGPV